MSVALRHIGGNDHAVTNEDGRDKIPASPAQGSNRVPKRSPIRAQVTNVAKDSSAYLGSMISPSMGSVSLVTSGAPAVALIRLGRPVRTFT